MSKEKKPTILYQIKLDRNEPCYCGSGKKYKNCCLENPKPNALELIDYYHHWKSSRVVNRLIESVIMELPEGLSEHFTSTYLDNPFLEGQGFNPDESEEWRHYHTTQIVNSTKLYIYGALISDSEDVAGLKEFVLSKAAEHGLNEVQIDYIYRISEAPGSFFMIEKTDPDNIATEITDIFSEEKIVIIDRSICRSGHPGEILFGKPVSYNPEKNQYVLEVPGISAIHFTHEDWIIDCIEDAFKMVRNKGEKKLSTNQIFERLPVLPVWIISAYMWFQSHPEITNFSGDSMRFLCAAYTFKNREEVISALAEVKGMDVDRSDKNKISMIWLEPKKKTILASIEIEKDILRVYVNSKERFKKFETIAKKIPGLKLRDVKEESVKKSITSSHKEKISPVDLSDDSEIKKEIIKLITKHYKSWADEKIPALDNKKPRDLVKTPEGRKKVEMMIDKIERDYEAMPPGDPMHGIKLDFLRKDLGI